jgi:hypothetical protein
MKNSRIILTLSFVTLVSVFSMQANADCKVVKEPGSHCPQKKCLNPIPCKNKNYGGCLGAIMNFFHYDAGAIHHQCMQRCSPADYDIVCTEETQSKPKANKRKN